MADFENERGMQPTLGDGQAPHRMPALFVGHGSPMLALADDELTHGLADMGNRVISTFGKPKAILAVSAHWYTPGIRVQTADKPRQVYDMYGFPDELYQVTYPVDGCPELGKRVLAIEGLGTQEDNRWGIDHGVWTLLVHMFPKADIPVVEYSIDRRADARAAYEQGQKLACLRDEGYLILGSGNVVHNLGAVEWDNPHGTPEADAFDAAIRQAVEARDDETVLDWAKIPHAQYAAPTPDHFMPLPVILGASVGERPVVFNGVRNLGSMSMTSYAFGLEA